MTISPDYRARENTLLDILGVHSNVAGDAALTDGHAWLSMHFQNGRFTTIGLWTTTLDEPRRFIKDPTGFMLGETFDVEFGRETAKAYRAKASRYYRLTQTEARSATRVLTTNASWRFSNTCASWATNVVRGLTGEELGSSEWGGWTNTPRALANAIVALERKQPTSLASPKIVVGNPVRDASFWSGGRPTSR